MSRCRSVVIVAVCMVSGILCVTGCGYRAGFLIPADVKSVHVKVAANDTFWREAVKTDNLPTDEPLPGPRPAFTMEVDLSERIKNEVVRRTPLKMANAHDADTTLKVTISDVAPHVLIRDANDNVLAQRVTIDVSFVWADNRNGRVLASATGLQRPTDFLTARGESFTTATRTSFDYIAEMIVERMQERF